jgi:hypothetical protein
MFMNSCMMVATCSPSPAIEAQTWSKISSSWDACGLLAGLRSFGFARIFGEPQVDRAIAFEKQMSRAKGELPEPQLISRETQAGLGLFTGVIVYSAAVGGLFFRSSSLSSMVASAASDLAPLRRSLLWAASLRSRSSDLKYPANPPSVGNPETIVLRTELFFVMLVISVVALVLGVALARRLRARYGAWNTTLISGATFFIVVAIVQYALPEINEVPEQFSAVVLWRFRVGALGVQGVPWTTRLKKKTRRLRNGL